MFDVNALPDEFTLVVVDGGVFHRTYATQTITYLDFRDEFTATRSYPPLRLPESDFGEDCESIGVECRKIYREDNRMAVVEGFRIKFKNPNDRLAFKLRFL